MKVVRLRRWLKIDRKENGWDELVCRLGRRGWTAGATAEATNLTTLQVRGRWAKYGISPLDARLGHSPDERRFLEASRRMIRETDRDIKAPQRRW